MRLFYCRHHSWNFGDELNPWLWSRAMPFRFNLADPWLFVGIGTILNWPMMHGKVVVFGAGLGYGEVTPRWLQHARAQWKFYCVRGPLTRASSSSTRESRSRIRVSSSTGTSPRRSCRGPGRSPSFHIGLPPIRGAATRWRGHVTSCDMRSWILGTKWTTFYPRWLDQTSC